MKVEVKTQMRHVNGKLLTIVDFLLVPRGSSNRRYARSLAAAWSSRPEIKPHLVKVVVGCSRVRLYFKPSLQMLIDVKEMQEKLKATEDVPGQGYLFGGGTLSA